MRGQDSPRSSILWYSRPSWLCMLVLAVANRMFSVNLPDRVMRNRRVRHHWSKQYIYLAPRGRSSCLIPVIKVHLLQTYLLTVQLPVLVDGYGLSSVDKCLHLRYEWLVANSNVTANILASIGCIVFILEECQIVCRGGIYRSRLTWTLIMSAWPIGSQVTIS